MLFEKPVATTSEVLYFLKGVVIQNANFGVNPLGKRVA
jgi:hypothetical protein